MTIFPVIFDVFYHNRRILTKLQPERHPLTSTKKGRSQSENNLISSRNPSPSEEKHNLLKTKSLRL
jgi:hypothetical protein